MTFSSLFYCIFFSIFHAFTMHYLPTTRCNCIELSNTTKALHQAVLEGDCDAVRACLETGTDVDSLDYNGKTSLHSAANNNQVPVLQLLLAYGANPNAIIQEHPQKGQTALQRASRYGYTRIIRVLLKAGANINFQINTERIQGYSALHLATHYNQLNTVIILLKNGINQNLKTHHHKTALELALCEGKTDLLPSFILEGKVNVNLCISGKLNGALLMSMAASNGKGLAMRFLVKAGVKIDTMPILIHSLYSYSTLLMQIFNTDVRDAHKLETLLGTTTYAQPELIDAFDIASGQSNIVALKILYPFLQANMRGHRLCVLEALSYAAARGDPVTLLFLLNLLKKNHIPATVKELNSLFELAFFNYHKVTCFTLFNEGASPETALTYCNDHHTNDLEPREEKFFNDFLRVASITRCITDPNSDSRFASLALDMRKRFLLFFVMYTLFNENS